MPEHSENATENMMSGIMDAIADKLPKQKSVRFDIDDQGSISGQAKKLFGGHKSVHHILGGGKSADVLLWRNKKISSSVLAVATAAWVFFEWLGYHLLTIVSFVLVFGMVIQFGWSSFAGMLNGSPSNVPRVELPEELFANIGAAVGAQVNNFLGSLQDVSSGRDLKQFLMVIAGFVVTAFIGSWFSLITVIYIGFVCAHTLPVFYERYHDQVDEVLYNMLGLVGSQYQKLDKGVLSKIPKGNLKFRKSQ
ncbi:reticulon-like protein B8 isoform X3 [Hordeum vulgare subsp. vulgare]|nr:reticulon-like protein B8 isoform X3 [Hordeum vulgare subsp. vulgare]XP_044966028.1 reticulon-like protein B8 isoform X3 [Hordeum vulgare subsp. vulgare]